MRRRARPTVRRMAPRAGFEFHEPPPSNPWQNPAGSRAGVCYGLPVYAAAFRPSRSLRLLPMSLRISLDGTEHHRYDSGKSNQRRVDGMQSTFKRLSETFETTPVSRRAMLGAIPALALASRAWAGTPQAGPPIPVEKLHSFGLAVRDVNRSMEFYQALFGMADSGAPGGHRLAEDRRRAAIDFATPVGARRKPRHHAHVLHDAEFRRRGGDGRAEPRKGSSGSTHRRWTSRASKTQ